jgi:molecular chaperone GrpE
VQIDTTGAKFDPNLHQAMFETETSDFEPGTVMQVLRSGYTIHGRLLRPAMVGIAKAPTA